MRGATCFNTYDNTWQSTTAGETSTDEDYFENPLFTQVGLSMEGLVEDSMFEITLDDEINATGVNI